MAKQVDYNDFWYIQDNPITKAGVYPYLGRQIDPSLEPDKVYMVLRPAEEIEKAKETFKLIPLVDEHTMLGADFTPAEKKGIHGVTGEQTTFKNGVLYTPIKIYSEFLKDEIENGKKELSCGYFCKYDLTPGEYNGVHYDAVQRDLRGNHIALVDNGRMGHDVRVMDSMCFACDSMDIGEIRHSFDFDENKIKRDKFGRFSETAEGGEEEKKEDERSKEAIFEKRTNQLIEAVNELKSGEEVEIKGLRDDLEQYGGSNDITIKYGKNNQDNKGYGIIHIAQKHGADVVGGVLNAIVRGKIARYEEGNKRVFVQHDGYEAILSLVEGTKKKTWLLSGYDIDENLDKKKTLGEDSKSRPTSISTQLPPMRARQQLVASVVKLLRETNDGLPFIESIGKKDDFVNTQKGPKGENMQAQDFDESKVKRDSDGKFSSTGGGAKEGGKSEGESSSATKSNASSTNEYRQRSTAASWIFEKLKPAQKKEVHEERKKIFGDKKYNRLQELLNKSYSYAYNSPEGKEERALSFEWNKAENEAVFNVAKRHGYSEEKIKEDLSNALTKLKHTGGYIEDSNDLSSKNHGNSGEDAATGKENEQMDKREIIREIMAVAAKPADQFQGGEEEQVETIAKLAEKIAYNPSEAEKADDEELLKKEEGLEEVKDEGKGCDEEEKDMEKVEEIKEKLSAEDSMKAVLKMLGKREALYTSLKPIIGAFDHADMTEESMAKYAAKKLNIAVDSGDDVCAVVKGYLKGAARKAEELVTFAADKAMEEKDNGFEQFMKGDK